MRILERPSPNHDSRPGDGVVDMLILHYTGMRNAAEALDRLCSSAAKVSAHYVIDEDGTVWRLVPEERRAWHAGVGAWRGRRDINGASIGIELVNPGHVLGHSDVAPQRKTDPGEFFDWARLARAGIGLWPDFAVLPPPAGSIAELQEQLAAIGYETPRTGTEDAATAQVIAAFQRHFRPSRCDGKSDPETRQRIAALAAATLTS